MERMFNSSFIGGHDTRTANFGQARRGPIPFRFKLAIAVPVTSYIMMADVGHNGGEQIGSFEGCRVFVVPDHYRGGAGWVARSACSEAAR